MSVAACQRRVSAAEFAEWVAYDRHQPIGQEPIHEALVLLACLTFNINKGRSAQALRVEDFIPGWPESTATVGGPTKGMLAFQAMALAMKKQIEQREAAKAATV